MRETDKQREWGRGHLNRVEDAISRKEQGEDIPMTDQSKDDATIEEAKRELERLWSHSPQARAISGLIDIATRRGEERDEARRLLAEAAREINCAGPVSHRIQVLKREHIDLRDKIVAERDALAEELARQREMAEGHPAMCCGQCDASVKALTEEKRQAEEHADTMAIAAEAAESAAHRSEANLERAEALLLETRAYPPSRGMTLLPSGWEERRDALLRGRGKL